MMREPIASEPWIAIKPADDRSSVAAAAVSMGLGQSPATQSKRVASSDKRPASGVSTTIVLSLYSIRAPETVIPPDLAFQVTSPANNGWGKILSPKQTTNEIERRALVIDIARFPPVRNPRDEFVRGFGLDCGRRSFL